MKKLRVSVGIPALNEEKNIVSLIQAIKSQTNNNFILQEIIVASDGSSDNTVEFLEALKDRKIKIINGKRRLGQQYRQNQILKKFKGDLLILIEADTFPATRHNLRNLVSPFTKGKKGLAMVFGGYSNTKPSTMYEKIINQGDQIKLEIFKNWKNGQNVYLNGGYSWKAITREFADKYYWPKDAPEDSYTYLRLKQLGLKMKRLENVKVYAGRPKNFPDSIKQSSKFVKGINSLHRYFPNNYIDEEYRIPKKLIFNHVFKALRQNCFLTLSFLLELVFNRLFTKSNKPLNPLYDTYESTKEFEIKGGINDNLRKSVSIGIAAFNEEANIGFLIGDLLKQKLSTVKLEKIVIYSDGSYDNTVEIVKSFKDKRINVIDDKDRQGKAFRINQIIKLSQSDVLIILDADILIKDTRFLEKLSKPIIEGRADLVSSKLIPVPSNTFLGNVLNTSINCKNYIFENYNHGINLFTCHGTHRAFSKRLYKKIRFMKLSGEDAYSYLYCIKNGFRYLFVKDTSVYYKAPSNFKDHEKQSLRYFRSGKKLGEIFGNEFVNKEYHVPPINILIGGLKYLLKYPIPVLVYPFIAGYLRIKSLFKFESKGVWEIAASSKLVRSSV